MNGLGEFGFDRTDCEWVGTGSQAMGNTCFLLFEGDFPTTDGAMRPIRRRKSNLELDMHHLHAGVTGMFDWLLFTII